MPNKAYAILFASTSEDDGYLYFPIKREGREYGGMPQFFGGTKDPGESDRDTIAREMREESDEKISLQPGALTQVYRTNVAGSTYSFYVAENFSGNNFLGPLKNPEMASIDKFFVQFDAGDDIKDLLRKLKITPTQQFEESTTYEAFDAAIKWAETASEGTVKD
ncbi:NUDIX hydrolase [Fulvivirga sp. 29W222]|uniref:NUDIX hydrolase n=1 Tax=Fulvivirga marina TaxID=2494733 RepID=A0A937G2P6_9BACT|nr:NUDIX hydrolase [Fulvivirga marina]MBL6449587.1 NUDIX hydrolase [Fulvivirga marina]